MLLVTYRSLQPTHFPSAFCENDQCRENGTEAEYDNE